jgi:biopolymer transport protein TolQ
MDPNTVAQTATAIAIAPPDFSVWALFMRADPLVKAVLIGLGFCSFWSWAIIFDKWARIGRAKRRSDQFEEMFWSGGSLDDLYNRQQRKPDGPMATVFVAAMREWNRSFEGGSHVGGLRERVDRVMSVTLGRELAGLERQLGFLATVGSTAPFIGLFGTVWGIMNSFRAIAASHDTNLSVVAPGIAEALFATALGLVAAIPAVIFYNRFMNELGRLSVKLEGFANEFSAYLSRKLDEKVR